LIDCFVTESANSFWLKAQNFECNSALNGKLQLRAEEKVRKYCGDYADFSWLIVLFVYESLKTVLKILEQGWQDGG